MHTGSDRWSREMLSRYKVQLQTFSLLKTNTSSASACEEDEDLFPAHWLSNTRYTRATLLRGLYLVHKSESQTANSAFVGRKQPVPQMIYGND
jgi:hypothetical protein